jgi:hypothetical protein
MAVFVCAADESADQNPRRHFFYGGFAAPISDWDGAFAEAWTERVLKGPPQIPYLHMTDIRSPAWRARYGLSERQANERLDEAARVIRSMGSLIPVMICVDANDYDSILRQPFLPRGKRRSVPLDPDYICFICFALTQLMWIHGKHPDVERVDCWVEQNGLISRYLNQFHEGSADALVDAESPELAPLVGEFKQVGKDRIPVQAADMLGWHARNHERDSLDRDGVRRYWRMTTGDNREMGRYGYRGPIERELLQKLAAGFARRIAEAEASAPAASSDGAA